MTHPVTQTVDHKLTGRQTLCCWPANDSSLRVCRISIRTLYVRTACRECVRSELTCKNSSKVCEIHCDSSTSPPVRRRRPCHVFFTVEQWFFLPHACSVRRTSNVRIWGEKSSLARELKCETDGWVDGSMDGWMAYLLHSFAFHSPPPRFGPFLACSEGCSTFTYIE